MVYKYQANPYIYSTCQHYQFISYKRHQRELTFNLFNLNSHTYLIYNLSININTRISKNPTHKPDKRTAAQYRNASVIRHPPSYDTLLIIVHTIMIMSSELASSDYACMPQAVTVLKHGTHYHAI